MREPELSSVVEIINRMAERDFGVNLDSRQVDEVLRQILWEPRNLWRAAEAGLVTESEVAGAVAAHVYRWMMDKAGRSWHQQSNPRWDDFIRDLEAALFIAK
jgi:hypothetical protein